MPAVIGDDLAPRIAPRCRQRPAPMRAESHPEPGLRRVSAGSKPSTFSRLREEVMMLVSKNAPDLGAPLRNRTVDLLLTIYPRADAVAICDDAGQVRGSARCCRPTYLVITRGPGGPGRRAHRRAPWLQSPRPPVTPSSRRAGQGATAGARAPRCRRRPPQPARPAPRKPAQRAPSRGHSHPPPDPAPQATRPGLGAQRDLPRVDRICR